MHVQHGNRFNNNDTQNTAKIKMGFIEFIKNTVKRKLFHGVRYEHNKPETGSYSVIIT